MAKESCVRDVGRPKLWDLEKGLAGEPLAKKKKGEANVPKGRGWQPEARVSTVFGSGGLGNLSDTHRLLAAGLETLQESELKAFKEQLHEFPVREGFVNIPNRLLEEAKPWSLGTLLLSYYGADYALELKDEVLMAIGCESQVDRRSSFVGNAADTSFFNEWDSRHQPAKSLSSPNFYSFLTESKASSGSSTKGSLDTVTMSSDEMICKGRKQLLDILEKHLEIFFVILLSHYVLTVKEYDDLWKMKEDSTIKIQKLLAIIQGRGESVCCRFLECVEIIRPGSKKVLQYAVYGESSQATPPRPMRAELVRVAHVSMQTTMLPQSTQTTSLEDLMARMEILDSKITTLGQHFEERRKSMQDTIRKMETSWIPALHHRLHVVEAGQQGSAKLAGQLVDDHENECNYQRLPKPPGTFRPLTIGSGYFVQKIDDVDIHPRKLKFQHLDANMEQQYLELYTRHIQNELELNLMEKGKPELDWEAHVGRDLHFIDQHREQLIQRTTNVEGVLDVLHGTILDEEQHQKISSRGTNPEKMRELYRLVPSWNRACKEWLYEALKTKHPHLIDDLERRSEDRLQLSSILLRLSASLCQPNPHKDKAANKMKCPWLSSGIQAPDDCRELSGKWKVSSQEVPRPRNEEVRGGKRGRESGTPPQPLSGVSRVGAGRGAMTKETSVRAL
ncbi:uncharacterized protein LOC133367498 [Rhineura floridana]|uniref:uncharacterized protein LOC133367498 n=1 Tax=Rhineura floridana TaxID=261503 RepID=UPI002AC7ED72|nr:uncharacterized protein LOC133367498 [Rhineura floridana]